MLEKNLGYNFQDQELLQTALRHRSTGARSNERMEYLGDSVLNFIITQELYHRFPKLREGELSRMRSSLVRKETLADISRELDVGEFLHLGAGEKKSGGHRRDSILADALEAIIAAIFLDSDLETCQKRVLHWYRDKWQRLDSSTLKDAKSRLQELVQARKLSLPEYVIVEEKGDDHEKIFVVACKVEGSDIKATGTGTSKQIAEQEAAERFLEQLTDLTP